MRTRCLRRPRRRCPRPRLIVFSPLPPLRNGIADYSAELLPHLAAAGEVVVVIDDHAPPPQQRNEHQVIRLAEYVGREAEFRDEPHLYQLGNNADHVYMLPWLTRRPGIVVLHDGSLHHLVDQATLRWDDHTGYAAALELEYGSGGRLIADQFRHYRWRTRSVFYELPLTREIISCSKAVIAHSLYAANKFAAQAPETPVVYVPHHVAPPALEARQHVSRAAARSELGIAAETLYIVSLGFVTKAKQIDTVLRFLARHGGRSASIRYVIVGQDKAEEWDVRSLISTFGLSDIVKITGYVDESTFYQHVIAADIVVNLRYPSGGETSGTLIRALGVGACVVVNDIGPFAEYPDDVCAKVRVSPDVDEHDREFERVMLSLVASGEKRRLYAARAARFVRASHDAAESARLYWETVQCHAHRPTLAPSSPPQAGFLPSARLEAALQEVPAAARQSLPLCVTTGEVPACLPSATVRMLVIGHAAADVHWLAQIFGYPRDAVDHHPDAKGPWSLPNGQRRYYQVALIEAQISDNLPLLADWLIYINGRLALAGHLLLTLRGQSTAPPHRLKEAIHSALEDAGFVVEVTTSQRKQLSMALDDGMPAASCGTHDPQLLLRSRKVSAFISPRLRRHRLHPIAT